MLQQNQRFLGILITIPLILLIPFIGTQVSSDVNWTYYDFVVGGILLLAGGIGLELILRFVKKPSPRLVFVLLFLALFLLTWAELAVGVFGTPWAGS